MNNLPIKTTFHVLTLLLLFPSYHTHAINSPWYKEYFHKRKGGHYRLHCSLIHTAQKIRGGALLTYYRATHKKSNLDKAMSLIQNQLKNFEPWIIELEREALMAIKEKYQVTDEIWHNYLADVHRIKKSHHNEMLNCHPDIVHDPNVPTDIINILTSLFEQNNINPYSINIKMIVDQEEINANPNTMARVYCFIDPITDKQKNIFTILPTYIPGDIEIFPHVKSLSLNEKISFCAHEIQHLIQHHTATDLILEEYLNYYYGITPEILAQTPEYHTLCQIHEAQAEILSSLNNPHTARCITMMRKKYLYPNHLYQEHFYHLSTIDMLWKVNAWLEFFNQNGLIKKRNEYVEKIKQTLHLFKAIFL